MGIKERLRPVIEAAREREAIELLPLVDDRPATTPGGWTVKDTVAHLSSWRDHATNVLKAVRDRGEAPSVEDVDRENAGIYAATRGLSAPTVVASAGASWKALLDTVEACSEQDLTRPRPHHPEMSAWEVIPGNAHGHLAEHLGYLAQEQGDMAAAEAVARWAYQLDGRLSSNDQHRANADYNLACFFARNGRPDAALALLQAALRRNPALKAWAQKDKDLDPIRAQPDVLRALA